LSYDMKMEYLSVILVFHMRTIPDWHNDLAS
jgi:hypothetical protein